MRTTFEGKTFESCFSRWKLFFLFLSIAILENFTCSQMYYLHPPSFSFFRISFSLSLSSSLVYTAQAIKRKKRRTSSDNCDPCYDAKFLFSYYARERRDERTTDERTNAFLSTRSFFFFKSTELAFIMNSRVVIRRTVLRVCASLATASLWLPTCSILPRAPTFPLVTLTLFGSVLREPRSRFTTSCKK